jgi:hypothetical protein
MVEALIPMLDLCIALVPHLTPQLELLAQETGLVSAELN